MFSLFGVEEFLRVGTDESFERQWGKFRDVCEK